MHSTTSHALPSSALMCGSGHIQSWCSSQIDSLFVCECKVTILLVGLENPHKNPRFEWHSGQVQTKQIARRLSTLQILPHCILQGAIPHLRSSMSVPACLPAYNNFKRTPFRLHQHQPPQNCVTVTVHPSSCL